jgi:hypothetical protein
MTNNNQNTPEPTQNPPEQPTQTPEALVLLILADMQYKTFSPDTPQERSIWTHKDNTPYQDFYHHAHGSDLLPDDHRYTMIHSILSAIGEELFNDPDLTLSDIDPVELIDPLVPVYNHDLLSWLSSHNSRYTYVDEAIQELGKRESIIDDIMSGYFMELEETYYLIIDWINTNSSEPDEAEEED